MTITKGKNNVIFIRDDNLKEYKAFFYVTIAKNPDSSRTSFPFSLQIISPKITQLTLPSIYLMGTLPIFCLDICKYDHIHI